MTVEIFFSFFYFVEVVIFGVERFGNMEAIGVMVLSFGIFRNCRVDDRFFFFSNFEIFLH